jgi:phosphoribosylglycinamide formyltransferase-1
MSSTTIVVLISGNGSNLQSIIDAIEAKQLDALLAAVISNNPDAYGLTRAKNHGIEVHTIDHRRFASREAFDHVLLDCIQKYDPDYIVLAGFMRILSSAFIQANQNKILNIHPSLLPDYKGLDTHRRVMENEETVHGVSIHLVTPELDDGPVLMQGRYPIKTDDTLSDLQHKGHALEHQMYPRLLQYLSQQRLQINNQSITFDHHPLHQPIEFANN